MKESKIDGFESCPFCGHNEAYLKKMTKSAPGFPIAGSMWFECAECHACGPIASSRELAIQLWNDRV